MLDKKKSKNRSIKLLRSNSQRSTIAKHLLLNGHITQWRAIERYHITRLSAHIFDLKHEFGLNIASDWLTMNGKRYTRYTLLSNPASDKFAVHLLPTSKVAIYERDIRKHV